MKKIFFLALFGISAFLSFAQNLNFQYYFNGQTSNFQTSNVSSDYGKRNRQTSSWHNGIDYGGDLGASIMSIEGGVVGKLQPNGYKYIGIIGTNNFCYGHIFEDDDNDLGDFVFLPVNSKARYAILNKVTGVAIGISNTDEVTYNGRTYQVQNTVIQGQQIAPLGNSGGNYPNHVHLYRLRNIDGNVSDDNNCLNSLQVINHAIPNYNISIENTTTTPFRITQANSTQCYGGNESSSVCVKVQMNNPDRFGTPPDVKYRNATMNLEKLELFIKAQNEANESYRLIRGVNYESRIEYGGRRNTNGTFTTIYPERMTTDATPFADNSYSGIEPHAYNDNDYDLFYFSDIFTRIHKNHNVGTTPGTYAECIKDALYPDGTYNLYAKATDIRNNQVDNINSPLTIKIDNFKPYVEELIVKRTSNNSVHYHGKWVWNGSALNFTVPTFNNATTGEALKIKVITSEPMQKVEISAFGQTLSSTTSIANSNSKEWEFSIAASLVTTGSKPIIIKSTSIDLAGNGIEGFISTSSINGSSIPKRQNDGVWSPIANTRDDNIHVIPVTSPPVADFTGNPTTLKVGNNVAFSDASANNPTSWSWTFQGGTPSTSTSRNPVVNYSSAGIFDVSLIVTDASGNNSSKTKQGYISVSSLSLPLCDFTMSSNQVAVGQTVTFSDISTNSPTSWNWTFSGGLPSSGNLKSHTVTFNSLGTYTISLQSFNADGGSNIVTKTVTVINPTWTISGIAKVNFVPTSGVLVSFEPGGTTTTDNNGAYSFSVSNNWSGVIKASKSGCDFIDVPMNPVTSDRTIDLNGTPVAAYYITYSPTNPSSGQPIEFKLNTLGSGKYGLWDFGDGGDLFDDNGLGKATRTFNCELYSNKTYTVKCTIKKRNSDEEYGSPNVSITIKKCEKIVSGAAYTNGCSTIRLGQPALLTDMSEPYGVLVTLNVDWGPRYEQYFTPLSPNYKIYTRYPISRQFSYTYTSKGNKLVSWQACANGWDDVCYRGFNVVDCNSTVYSAKLSSATFDDWGGVNKYWSGKFILSTLNSISNYNDKKVEFSVCNDILLKPGFSSKPSGNNYLYLNICGCLNLSGKSLNETGGDENSIHEPIVSSVYPNPANQNFNLVFNQNYEGAKLIEIYNSVGQLVFVKRMNENEENILSSSWPCGLYTLRIVFKDYIAQTIKVVISR